MITGFLDHAQRSVLVELLVVGPTKREHFVQSLKGEFEVFGQYTGPFSRIERKVNEEDLNDAIDYLIESGAVYSKTHPTDKCEVIGIKNIKALN